MMDLEAAMLALSKFVSTVVEDLKSKTKLIAEVEINLVSKIVAVPRTEADKTVKVQEAEVSKECAKLIASKLITLRPPANLIEYPPHEKDTDLMKKVREHLDDPTFDGNAPSERPKSVVTETLAPKVIKMDGDGRALSSHETVATKKEQAAEVIPWMPWVQTQTRRNYNEMAKMLLSLAMSEIRDKSTTAIPLALVKQSGCIKALATKYLEKGELVIPLFFKRQSSVVVKGEAGATVHPRAVCAMVSWTMDPTVEEIEAGVEGKGECIVSVHVQPELKLPNQTDKGDYEWAQSNALHPFWFIKRAEKNDEPNAEVKHQDVTHVSACSFSQLNPSLKVPLEPAASTFGVSVPVIVNTRCIEANTEVILRANHPQSQTDNKKKDKAPPTAIAFDQLAQQEKKKRKTQSTVVD